MVLPAALNLGISALAVPLISAVLTRSDHPADAIAGFAVAYGLVALIAIPHLRIQQLTLVFGTSRPAILAVRRFVAILALLSLSAALITAATPLGGWVLTGAFELSGGPLQQAKSALLPLTPFVFLACFRTHFYGVMLAAGRTRTMWGAISSSLAVAGLATALLIRAGTMEPAAAAGAGQSLAVAAECAILYIADRRHPGTSGPAAIPSPLQLARFFAPLLFAALLPSLTPPILHAAMARSADAATGIAAHTLAWGLISVLTVPLWGLQPTVLSLLGAGVGRRSVALFAYLVGAMVLVLTVSVTYIPPLATLLLEGVLGASGQLFQQARLAVLVLALLPPVFALEQVFSAALLARRRPVPFIWINLIRLFGLTAAVALALLLAPAAIWVGVAGGFAGLAVESITTYFFGRSSFAQLATASSG